MTEDLPGNATSQQENPSPEFLKLAEVFSTQLNTFHWRGDYLKFCEVLAYTPDDWAESKYLRFKELVEALNQFDTESLAKLLEAGL